MVSLRMVITCSLRLLCLLSYDVSKFTVLCFLFFVFVRMVASLVSVQSDIVVLGIKVCGMFLLAMDTKIFLTVLEKILRVSQTSILRTHFYPDCRMYFSIFHSVGFRILKKYSLVQKEDIFVNVLNRS